MTTTEWTNEIWNPVTGCTKVSQDLHDRAEHAFDALDRAFGGDEETQE